MPNTLTDLIPTLYEALDVVSRELSGFIPAVSRDSGAERAAVGQSVDYPVVGAMAADDIAAGATGPDPAGQTITTGTLTISRSRGVAFPWSGEEQRGVAHSGQLPTVLQQQFQQAMRTLVNEVERDIAGEYVHASRAFGEAGATPFASDLEAAAQIRKILDDNGAPPEDRGIVIDTTAGLNLRKMTQLTKANEAGTTDTLRQGTLLDLHGFAIRESAQIRLHDSGTTTAVTLNGAADKGDTEITVAVGTAIDLEPGDVVEIGNYKYVVAEKIEAAGDLVIAAPGLREDVATGEDVDVVDADYTANLGFARSAIHLVTRAPAMPEGGDSADDVLEIQDPRTGLAFQVALYRQRRQVSYEVGLAWGQRLVKPEHTAILLG